ncbi:MAG: non-reducing end alpha-L-arabinofuranosidase family hydrolase, partial [Fibrobacterota bacterium]
QLAHVDGAGRYVWEASVTATNGIATTTLPANHRTGAIFLRIRHAGGVEYQAVTIGSKGMQVAPSRAAARSMATYPVLVFKKSGYNDTTFKMTSESQTAVAVTMTVPTTCELPTTFKWKDYGKPIVEPKNGWLAVKDFTMVRYNNQYIVYMTYTPAAGGFQAAYMAPFSEFSQANAATQAVMPNRLPGVAPELIYFTPKKQWVFSTQWCGGGFCYTTGTDPTKPTSFNATTQSLLSENITTAGNPLEGNKGSDTGPIDQVLICDDNNCFLFYNDDNGRVYRASMPKANFPGKFSGSKMIIQDTKTRLFEAIEVYKLKGQKKYLMIVECAWTRYFRAFTATDLGGEWTPLGNTREEATPFAGAKNVTGGWSTDISHGEMVRTGHDEYREIDPCNLQMIYQGKNGGGDYDKLPYRMGLLTAIK